MKISIITVCYNSEETIEETFNSVLNLNGINQNFNLEYVVVDGLSTDKTLEIITTYKNKFENKKIDLKVISEKDNGIYDAWNKGLKICNGELIGILSSDDCYLNDAINNVVSLSKNQKGKYIITGLRNQITFKGEYKYTRGYKTKLSSAIKWRMPLNFTATFISKEVFYSIGTFNISYKLSADYEFIYRAIIRKINFIFTNDILVNMRDGGATYTESNLFISAKEDNTIRKSMGVNFPLSTFIFLKRTMEIWAILIRNKYFR
jgi:glycosyltransferase involved in cell wall biosynthesis